MGNTVGNRVAHEFQRLERVRQGPTYSDLNLNFVPHPLTGDIPKCENFDAIKQSIRNLIYMEAFDIPFDPDKKSRIRETLFDQASQLTIAKLRSDLEWLIKRVEPRIELINIDVKDNPESYGYDITIMYHIKSIMKEDSTTFFVQRIR